MIERLLERFLFASRWLLAPFYVMLVAALGVLLLRRVRNWFISSAMATRPPNRR